MELLNVEYSYRGRCRITPAYGPYSKAGESSARIYEANLKPEIRRAYSSAGVYLFDFILHGGIYFKV